MRKKVMLADVVRWLKQAMEAAQADPGDAGGDVTARSYRELRVTFVIETGNVHVYVITRNREFAGYWKRTHYSTTADGAEVEWREEDIGVVNGADWLPTPFVKWMEGETPPVR